MDLTGITNVNEYYTNHYLASVFEENAKDTIKAWTDQAKDNDDRTPWSKLRSIAQQYYALHERYLRSRYDNQTLAGIKEVADAYLAALDYPEARPELIQVAEDLQVPVYLELRKNATTPWVWVILTASQNKEADDIMSKFAFDGSRVDELEGFLSDDRSLKIENEALATKIFFGEAEPPRFILFVGMQQIALLDRNKWNEKRYLQFEMDEVFRRCEESTFKAMSILLHKESLCPEEGQSLLDQLDENSHRHAAGVSGDLKYALRESIELLGNEVLYDLEHRQGRDLQASPVDAGQLTLECLRYMYRMLFVLFIESKLDLGYAPIKTDTYLKAYSLESLRDIADSIREDMDEVGDGYYMHETLAKLYELIYTGYPANENEWQEYHGKEGMHDTFVITPLKAHIFDPQYTELINQAKIRNRVMLRIVELMSLTRPTGRRNERRGRISYANLGINQMGAVYEALLSYRGFIAEEDLYEVKKAGDKFDPLTVGYFVKAEELEQYTEDERVRYESSANQGKLRMYPKGTFIYRLAGREREKSASYYTPEVLTKCLVKYALKELLEGKTADEILQLTVCEPAMGSAAFLNEAISQLAEAYLNKKQQELGELIPANERLQELQKVKMYIADRNVYGIDLNPIAVELAEVSLWLNTIFEGGYVPWFGTQLVNGNSLIGARRQCYNVDQLTTTSRGMRWYENAPERVLMNDKRKPKKQIYHFLLGDTGMCNYTDRVIKSLEPDNIKYMKDWNKKFTKPYTEEEVTTLQRLSSVIDTLWEKQVELRNDLEKQTQDELSVYGHNESDKKFAHNSIRQKDKIYKELYKSEEQMNAGPYARLKFAMDYWCALWFWPIEEAELLPTRSEFLFDMSLILEGTVASVNVSDEVKKGQGVLWATEEEQRTIDLYDAYGIDGIVDIPALLKNNKRLVIAHSIAEQNKFMHWELEFADLFAERGGFDLFVGNPPWIKMEWNEQSILADQNPMFAVKRLTATQTAEHRKEALTNSRTHSLYFTEYETMAAQQSFLNAISNYPDLKGQQTNLYKCFLPQAWMYGDKEGVSAFVHPEGIYDDPNGGILREKVYPRLRYHFQFTNELKLFAEVHHNTVFGLSVYSNKKSDSFDSVANLFAVKTIEDCYSQDINGPVTGIKDKNGNWNTQGHPERILKVGKRELAIFAKFFDDSNEWKKAKLPVLHARALVEVLNIFAQQEKTLHNTENVTTAVLWDETNNQVDGTVERNVEFPKNSKEVIYSGPHIAVGNPLFKTSRRICRLNSDYDSLDLLNIPEDYMQRCNYRIACDYEKYKEKIPNTSVGTKYDDDYRICMRKMLNLSGERTLMSTIIPPLTNHINGIFGINMAKGLVSFAVNTFSIPYDFYAKSTGKANINYSAAGGLPILKNWKCQYKTICRGLILNCLTVYYDKLWKREYDERFNAEVWSKKDSRLSNTKFSSLTSEWNWDTPLRTDYERRQALVEIDVLTAMALGMTLEQLRTIYRIQFPVLQSYEADTWYDAKGRIVFTNNRSLTGVGFTRPEFEKERAVAPVERGEDPGWDGIMKDAPAGYVFERTISDDTMPGGPIERTIRYYAPFDRCDREQDYETAWKFFEEKYKEETK